MPAGRNALEVERWLISRLDDVVYWDRDNARAHLELAECHLRLFEQIQRTAENPMSLANLRDAAIQSRFCSREALKQWLSQAVGAHLDHLPQALQHVRQALRLSPLQGRGYVYLAELCFLEGDPNLQPCDLDRAGSASAAVRRGGAVRGRRRGVARRQAATVAGILAARLSQRPRATAASDRRSRGEYAP